MWNLPGWSYGNISYIAICSLQPGLPISSPQFPLNSHKIMPLIEMSLPSESRLIAFLYLCSPLSPHCVWEDRSLQQSCLQRSVPCIAWTQEGCLLLLFLMDPQSMGKCWHKWLLLQLTKFWKDWLKPVPSQKLLSYLYLLWNSALQPSFWRKPKVLKA